MKAQGGCLCGQLRYAIDAELIDAGFCHCRLCQRSSGSPAMAWLTIPFSGFSYSSGEVGIFQSSEQFQREYCPRCGTQISFRAQSNPQRIDVTVCSLDHPDAVQPEYHIWCQSKVSWLHINDDIPQYPDGGPDL